MAMTRRNSFPLSTVLPRYAVFTLCAAAVAFAGVVPSRSDAQALPTGAPPPTSDASGAAVNAAVPTSSGIGGVSPGLGGNQIAGKLVYSLTASELVSTGNAAYSGGSGTATLTNVGGQAAFVSGSERQPTSFLYSGGYLFSNGNGYQSSAYQNFGVSQVLSFGRVSLTATDLVSYLPSSPVFGLSGVAGTGDLGAAPIGTGAIPTQSILTNYGRRITNTASLAGVDDLGSGTSISGSGAYTLLHFPDANGLDSDQVTAAAGVNQRFSARSSGGMYYSFSKYTYAAAAGALTGISALGNVSFTTQSVGLDLRHLFTRKLSLDVSAGPQFISSSQAGLLPSQTSVAVSAALSYNQPRTSYGLSYSRGANAGSGVVTGSISDNINFNANHRFSRNWNGSASADYGHAQSLANLANGASGISTDSFYGGIQASRRIGDVVSAYASYNLQAQSVSNPNVALNAYSGTNNTFGFGVSVSPRPIRLGRR